MSTEYIERGALMNEIEKHFETIGANAQRLVARFPAADVEPVVREECDHCSSKEQRADNGEPYSMEWYLVQNGCKFCPECGRRLHMDERSDGK